MDVVGLCNAALGLVGAGRITALDDASTEAELCSTLYAPARDSVLEAKLWTFAVERSAIAADSTGPAYGFTYRYPLPALTLRVLEVGDGQVGSDIEWVREGGFVLTNQASPVYVRVVKRIEDPTLWSPSFVQALIYRLASDLAVPLSENRSRQADLWNMYQSTLRTASMLDGTQGRADSVRPGNLSRARE